MGDCLGSVKVDVHKYGSYLHYLTLSDINVVELLIRFRDKIDIYYKREVCGTLGDINEEVIALYVDLDNLIKQCDFDDMQLRIIDLLQRGYNYHSIAQMFALSDVAIKNRFDVICRKIVKKHTDNWLQTIYLNNIKCDWKTCPKCKNTYPLIPYFFGFDSSRNNFRRYCKKCQ